ncbi:MAG: hypothetical protein K2H97_00515 [Prevotella sp.]|nr:hypothetical protein [Prevotella sp.]
MGKTSRDAGRFKYGVCLNDECPMCKSKKVQQIPMRKELVCSECGKPLRESAPPEPPRWGAIAVVAVIVIIAAAVLWLTGAFGGGANDSTIVPSDSISIDSIGKGVQDSVKNNDAQLETEQAKLEAEKEKVKAETEKTKVEVQKEKPQTPSTPVPPSRPTQSSSGTLSLSYGTYTGAVKDGYPNGQGRLVYKTTRQISKYDSKGRTAQPGDYVQGEFVNGFITIGKHYNAQGELLGTINAGAPDGVYESK